MRPDHALSAANELVVMGACPHCNGSGYCTRRGCMDCARYQQFTESSECGPCQGTAIRIERTR